MRVVFMGTPGFAVPALDALSRAHEVVGVYTRPDAVSRRGSALVASPVKLRALELGADVRQPASLKSGHEDETLAALAPDIIVVAAYGLILPPSILDIPPLGAVNIHASLLPRWRGAAPVQRAILAGDTVTGVSIMRMEEGLDTGPYALQRPIEIGERDAESLTAALSEIGAAAALEVLDRLACGGVTWTDQVDEDATYAEKITKGDVRPSPTLPVDEILRRVRASGPTAPARIVTGSRGLTLLECRRPTTQPTLLRPGAIACSPQGLLLGAADGTVLVARVKPDGRHAMDGDACARGMSLSDDSTWEGS